jgi:hypothetical protein
MTDEYAAGRVDVSRFLILNHDREGAYLNEVDFIEGVVAPRLLYIKDGDDVFMVEVPEELHLSECP